MDWLGLLAIYLFFLLCLFLAYKQGESDGIAKRQREDK